MQKRLKSIVISPLLPPEGEDLKNWKYPVCFKTGKHDQKGSENIVFLSITHDPRIKEIVVIYEGD